MRIIPYINLAGNAEEAMGFYKEVFGGKTEIQRWSEMPPNPKMPVSDDWHNKVMRGKLLAPIDQAGLWAGCIAAPLKAPVFQVWTGCRCSPEAERSSQCSA